MNKLLLLAPRLATNRLWARAGEIPSFHISPAALGHARDLITGTVNGTYNSASPATAVGPDGVLFTPAANAPVIEYDPVTRACLGARIWGVVTNVRPYSEDIQAFSDYSVQNATLVRQSTTTPIQGLGQATKLALNTGANTGNSTDGMKFGSGITLSATTVYTQSIFARPAGSNILRLRSNLTGQVFDIPIAGPAPSPTGAITACTVQTGYANGWSRISWTFTTTTGAPGARADYWTLKTDVANSSDGIWLTGAQLNTGPLAPYVPTTTTAASSTADVWDVLSLAAGINNIRSLYVRGRTTASGIRGILSLNDNSASNRLELLSSGTDPKAVAVTSNSTVADLNGGAIAANVPFRLAARFAADSYALSLNGATVATDATGARAVIDRLFIGRDQAGNYMNGYIEEAAGWTGALSNSTLQSVTT